MIDRIVHHADVLTLKGASYRLKHTGNRHPALRTSRQHGTITTTTVAYFSTVAFGLALDPGINNRPAQHLVMAASAIRIASASASHRWVEPSTSVNRNVTTPKGGISRGHPHRMSQAAPHRVAN